MEVIEASTRRAAAVCGQGDFLGTLEPGKLADMIIVRGDPLTDLAAMDNVTAVIKGGELAYSLLNASTGSTFAARRAGR
jgi:imidazolonepropionase-like amidohydrolase